MEMYTEQTAAMVEVEKALKLKAKEVTSKGLDDPVITIKIDTKEYLIEMDADLCHGLLVAIRNQINSDMSFKDWKDIL